MLLTHNGTLQSWSKKPSKIKFALITKQEAGKVNEASMHAGYWTISHKIYKEMPRTAPT